MIVLFAFYFIVDKYVLIFEALSRRETLHSSDSSGKKKRNSPENIILAIKLSGGQTVSQTSRIEILSEEMNAFDMTAAKHTPVFLILFLLSSLANRTHFTTLFFKFTT